MLVYAILVFVSLIVSMVIIWIIRRVSDLAQYKQTVVDRRQKSGLLSSFLKSRFGRRKTALRDDKGKSKTPWGW